MYPPFYKNITYAIYLYIFLKNFVIAVKTEKHINACFIHPPMHEIRMILEDKEYEAMLKIKKDQTWKQLFLSLLNGGKK